MTEFRAGVIGFGYMGKLHAEAFARTAGAQVTGIADPNPESQKAVPAGAQYYSDYRELLASNVDVVSICTPTHLHCSTTLAALESGKHVLLEKPIANDLQEADRMLEAAHRAAKTLFVGMTHRFYPELQEAKKLLDEGRIGKIVQCRDSILEHFGFLESPPWYLDKGLAGGGTVLTSGIHLVDRLRWFTGEQITHVSGQAGNPYFGLSVEDSAQMQLRFHSGLTGQITFAWMREPHPLVCDLEVVGTKGSLVIHTWKGYELRNGQGTLVKNFYDQEPHPQKVLVGVMGEVEEFLNSIRERRTPSPSAEESTEALQVVMAFYRAAQSGAVEPVEAISSK
jgi:UDP-N-acetyl-2-amino-2-deoxyglucuronate dehydrogenase